MKLLISRQDGYSMIAANILYHFQAIFHMPMKLDPAQSDKGCGIKETLPSCCRKLYRTFFHSLGAGIANAISSSK